MREFMLRTDFEREALYISEGVCPTCNTKLDEVGGCHVCSCWWSVHPCSAEQVVPGLFSEGEMLTEWSLEGPIDAARNGGTPS